MYIHTDTETTGIPVPGAPSDDPRHPHLASISAFLDQDADTLMGEFSTLVHPLPGIRFEDFPEAFRIHGITTEQATAEGMPLQTAIENFVTLAKSANTFSSFSAHFDFKLLKIACARIVGGDQLREQLERLDNICTMESAAMGLIGKKRISLKNAYFELFHEETQTDKHHGSYKDAAASRRIFWELRRRGWLIEPKATARAYESPAPEKNANGEYTVSAPAKERRPKTPATEATTDALPPARSALRKPAVIRS